LLPGAYVGRTDRRLTLAGRPLELSSYYFLVFAVAVGAGLAYYLLIFVLASGTPHAALVVLGIFPVLIGAYLPSFWLSSQANGRQNAMLRGLPDTMDLLTICVEAGLGLDAAFHRVAEKQSGPLVDEIRTMLREIGLGKTRREALLDLSDRTQLEDVRVFANAVIQAEQLGTSLAQVLRAQSQRLRIRRRQRAEQEARRVPVKMVFPLVFCMMPSLFIFILGPIIINIIEFVSGD
jgi:tight adherence protein C